MTRTERPERSIGGDARLDQGAQPGQAGGAGLARPRPRRGEVPHRPLGGGVVDRDEHVDARRRPSARRRTETVPQFSPAMIESCGPGTSTGRPASAERSPHAAVRGSTADDRARLGREVLDHGRGEGAHAHLHDHDVGCAPAAASCSSTSAKIVE